MKEQRITFETAKLAKEKGFLDPFSDPEFEDEGDEYLFAKFYINRELKSRDRDRTWDEGQLIDPIHYQDYDGYPNYGFSFEYEDCIFASTQSLLQKWLREDCRIMVEITWHMCSTGYEYAVISMDNEPQYNDEIERSVGHKTYEEALEKGLQEALKLIEK